MADLPESPVWEPGIRQIEQDDPVLGGPPNIATGAGLTNIPLIQLTRRTAWLKAESDALVGRSVLGGGLVSGGGTLDADRTLTVTPASQADAEDGSRHDRAMTPLSTRQAIDDLLPLSQRAHGYLIADWDTATESGVYRSNSGAANAPNSNNTFLGRVDAMNGVTLIQTLTAIAESDADDTSTWRRTRLAGTWSDWYRVLVSQDEIAAQFTGNLTTNGWQRLPSGLIMQWGLASGRTTNFPVVFPTACFVVTFSDSGSTAEAQAVESRNVASFTLDSGGDYTGFYLALGR